MNTIHEPLKADLEISRTPARRALTRLLTPLEQLAQNSDHLLGKPFGQFESKAQNYSLPRYIYLGPQGGGDAIRLGVFATIHGDEPEGAAETGARSATVSVPGRASTR